MNVISIPAGARIYVDRINSLTIDYAKQLFFQDGYLKIGWDDLKPYFENKCIGSLWWDFTENERRLLSHVAIINTLFRVVNIRRSGKPNCEGGEGSYSKAQCVTNTLIRQCTFGIPFEGTKNCYYKYNELENEICYYPLNDGYYGLPVYAVSCVSDNNEFGHSMCSILVKNDYSDYNNWIIFQYLTCDIKPGDEQIPTHKYNVTLSFSKISGYSSCYSFYNGTPHTFML